MDQKDIFFQRNELYSLAFIIYYS